MKYKVAIIGGGKGGFLIYQTLKHAGQVELVGMADINPLANGMEAARRDGVYVTTKFTDLFKIPGLDIIIEATGQPHVQEKIYVSKPPHTVIMDGKAAELMTRIIDEKQQLLKVQTIQSELAAILNSVQEGIEVVASDGVIKYVNLAFNKITGLPSERRIGCNIFDVSPHGALARCLQTRQPVFGQRSVVGGTEVEVLANAAPIYAGDEMVGAVVVFQPLNEFMDIMEEFQRKSRQLEHLSVKFEEATSGKYTFDDVIGADGTLRKQVTLAKKLAGTHSTVLLLGESGTGKELFAHAIHNASGRREKPFIKVNCAAIPETLLESEFFGYEKGAFTGAVRDKMGKFELANRGTIFLDEIGDMSLNLQVKLLRVLQEREIERLGATTAVGVDVRVIAATNRNLQKLIAAGQFREDLYYRLHVVEITLPPLRQRTDDIPELVNHMLLKLSRLLGRQIRGLSEEAMSLLHRYAWPGNLRELENVIERAVVTADTDVITSRNLGIVVDDSGKNLDMQNIEVMPVEEMERRLYSMALAKYGRTLDGKRAAAAALGVSLATLYNKVRKFGF